MRVRLFYFLLLLSYPALSISYSYHPSTPLYLGAGFDPVHLDHGYRTCIEYAHKVAVDGPGAVKTRYSLNLVSSKRELFEQLNISASISARGLFWSAHGNVDYFSEHKFHSDSLTWALVGRSEYGRFIMKNPQLAAFADKLIQESKFEQFERMCGREFITQETRATLIAAVFSIDNVAEEKKSKLEAQFKASMSVGLFKGDIQTQYADFFAQAATTSRITLSVYAIGGSGIVKLSNLVLHPNNLQEVQQVIHQYMQTMTAEQAAPIEYLSAPMETFGFVGKSPAAIFKRERTLAELYYRYDATHNAYKRLESILLNSSDPYHASISSSSLGSYQKHYNAHAAYLSTLMNAADTCYNEVAGCNLPEYTLERIVWPVDLLSECERLRLNAFTRGFINEQELQRMRRRGLAPILNLEGTAVGADVICKELNMGE